jgi:uncharacterized protein (TIGR03067 family)
MTRFMCAALMVIPAAVAAADDAAVKKELKALEGNWKAVAASADGKDAPKDRVPEIIFSIRPDGTSTGQTPGGDTEATLTVDPAKLPKTLDIAHTGGSLKGQKQYAVYKLEGGKLTIAATPPGSKAEERPGDFTKGVVLVFERVKADKKP